MSEHTTDHPGKPDAIPVTPRPAASLILLREGQAGPEVLMGMRGAGHRFFPNRLVFPGGAVEPADHDAPCTTPPRPDVLRRLAEGADVSLARALPAAAARELEEETGLSMGTPPALDVLDYLCRAITPAASPIRFDARFLVAAALHARGVIGGSGELEGLRWFGIEEALALDLALVTRAVLQQLLGWMELSEDARRGRTHTPVFRERQWHLE
jgi:8-oxo-dGTP pyrophosphatase MutT (NUDIX family)